MEKKYKVLFKAGTKEDLANYMETHKNDRMGKSKSKALKRAK